MPGMPAGDDDAGRRLGRVREPEERQRVAVAHVEEEVLAHAVRQVERLDQRHAEHVRVEVDGLRHVLADQRQVIDAADRELAVRLVAEFGLRHLVLPRHCSRHLKHRPADTAPQPRRGDYRSTFAPIVTATPLPRRFLTAHERRAPVHSRHSRRRIEEDANARLRQVSRADATPDVAAVYDRLFPGRDPVAEPGTATGTPGNWWTVFALVARRPRPRAGGLRAPQLEGARAHSVPARAGARPRRLQRREPVRVLAALQGRAPRRRARREAARHPRRGPSHPRSTPPTARSSPTPTR